MKNLFTILASVLLTAYIFLSQYVYAQVPQKLSYQAVIRDANNQLIKNHSIGIRVNILQDSAKGTIVYNEIYNPNPETNTNGLLTLEIGGGIPITGTFSSINWSSGPYYIKTEIDPTGGTNYTIIGTSQFLSVPYSLHSKTTDKILNDSLEIKVNSDSLYLRRLINTNTTYLNNETNLRITGDSNLETRFFSDSSYLKGLINTNTTNLNIETNSRITGDNNLKIILVSDSSYLKGLINTNTTNLNNETNSRITGDNNLKTRLVSDSSYLKGLINNTQSKLTAGAETITIETPPDYKKYYYKDQCYLFKNVIFTQLGDFTNTYNYAISTNGDPDTMELFSCISSSQPYINLVKYHDCRFYNSMNICIDAFKDYLKVVTTSSEDYYYTLLTDRWTDVNIIYSSLKENEIDSSVINTKKMMDEIKVLAPKTKEEQYNTSFIRKTELWLSICKYWLKKYMINCN